MKYRFMPTAIGSFPHMDPGKAYDAVRNTLSRCPVWPQLPNRSFRENMYAQYAEGLPGIVIDEEAKRIYFDTSGDQTTALAAFYEKVLAEDPEGLPMTPEAAAGFYLMTHRFEDLDDAEFVKGHVTGPVSFALTVCDENGRAVFYNETLMDAVVSALALKARFQIRRLAASGRKVIMFVDEPYLASYGSAYVPMEREQVVGALDRVFEAVSNEGAVAGVHCCGNTDWSMLMETKASILNFDACAYFQGLALYSRELSAFFEKGRSLAWGAIPTDASLLRNATVDSIVEDLRSKMAELSRKGFSEDELLESSLLTPSCGLGTLPVELAEKALSLTMNVSARLFA